jgi:hypothetical protein
LCNSQQKDRSKCYSPTTTNNKQTTRFEFGEFISNEKSWTKDLFQHTKIRNKEKLVSTNSNPYLKCSDGGLRENIRGFGLIIQQEGEIILENKCRIPKV